LISDRARYWRSTVHRGSERPPIPIVALKELVGDMREHVSTACPNSGKLGTGGGLKNRRAYAWRKQLHQVTVAEDINTYPVKNKQTN